MCVSTLLFHYNRTLAIDLLPDIIFSSRRPSWDYGPVSGLPVLHSCPTSILNPTCCGDRNGRKYRPAQLPIVHLCNSDIIRIIFQVDGIRIAKQIKGVETVAVSWARGVYPPPPPKVFLLVSLRIPTDLAFRGP